MAPQGAIRLFDPPETQKMENVKSEQQESGSNRLWRKARSPVLAAIRQDIWGPAHQAILDDTRRAVRRAWERRRAVQAQGPAQPAETFDSLVHRKHWTEAELQSALAAYLRVHWCMYVLAGVFIVNAAWLALNVGPLPTAAALIAAGGAAVHGYLYGYRAWQIRNRKLRTLGDAVRDIDTYLVI